MGPAGMEEMSEQLRGMFSQLGGARRKTRKLKIGEAMKLLIEEEAGKLVNEDEIRTAAIHNAEQNGIVFIDEIDKVASRSGFGGEGGGGADVSRQGVQRDLLPLVEGTTVSTKYGPVRTDHILFIASGAFHLSKPSDLIPELQGRLPIRVELKSLSVEDFEAILTQTHASLVKQYQALLATEGVTLEFTRRGHHAAGADCLRRQRAHRKHRRAAAGHGDGAPARRNQLRRRPPAGSDGGHRRGLCRCPPERAEPGRGSVALHSLTAVRLLRNHIHSRALSGSFRTVFACIELSGIRF